MSLASFGVALSLTIYFSYSMTHVDDRLKGSAMALTQSLRLFLTSGLVWLAAIGFDGSTRPMSVIAVFCALISVLLYTILYAKKLHHVSIAV
jgi:DHA1 family bicyclomycin/chloramphenicol resistance-like MFS transporter